MKETDGFIDLAALAVERKREKGSSGGGQQLGAVVPPRVFRKRPETPAFQTTHLRMMSSVPISSSAP